VLPGNVPDRFGKGQIRRGRTRYGSIHHCQDVPEELAWGLADPVFAVFSARFSPNKKGCFTGSLFVAWHKFARVYSTVR
jgi:hypothetical protein